MVHLQFWRNSLTYFCVLNLLFLQWWVGPRNTPEQDRVCAQCDKVPRLVILPLVQGTSASVLGDTLKCGGCALVIVVCSVRMEGWCNLFDWCNAFYEVMYVYWVPSRKQYLTLKTQSLFVKVVIPFHLSSWKLLKSSLSNIYVIKKSWTFL